MAGAFFFGMACGAVCLFIAQKLNKKYRWW